MSREAEIWLKIAMLCFAASGVCKILSVILPALGLSKP